MQTLQDGIQTGFLAHAGNAILAFDKTDSGSLTELTADDPWDDSVGATPFVYSGCTFGYLVFDPQTAFFRVYFFNG